MRENRFSGKNVLITGGSSGIGLEIAVEFGKLGANLFLVARNNDKLRDAKASIQPRVGRNVEIHALQADVGVREDIETVIRQVGEKYGGLHTLINNAGVSLVGLLEDIPVEKIEQNLRNNYLGMLYPLKAAWPYLKKSGDGHIGFVSSIAGFLGVIGFGGYAPSKFAVTGLAECVRMEAADYGIGVTVLFPPDTRTAMLQYERDNAPPESQALSKTAQVMAPDAVARKFVQGISKHRFEVICNVESRLIRLTKALWPGLYFKSLDAIVARDRRRRSRATAPAL